MRKTAAVFGLPLLVGLCCSGCASLLNGKYQRVAITTGTTRAEVYVDGNLTPATRTKLKRDLAVRQVRVDAAGYKPEYKAIMQHKRSGLWVLDGVSLVPVFVLPLGTLFIPFAAMTFLYDVGGRAFNYERVTKATPRTKVMTKKPDEKYLILSATAFNVGRDKLKVRVLSHKGEDYTRQQRPRTTNDEDIRYDNTIFSTTLSKLLEKNGYADTANTVLKNNLNTLTLKASVSELSFKKVLARRYSGENSYLVAAVTVTWELNDVYQQNKFKQILEVESGEFSNSFYKDETVKLALEDALVTSFYQFLAAPQVQALLKRGESIETKRELITLRRPTTVVSDVEGSLAASVTIKTSEGHGSGFIISPDGYVLTNYHVVAGQKKICITTADKQTYVAKLVRSNELMDLALLKTELKTDQSFVVDDTGTQDFRVGQDIFAIGTPTSVDLGQTLTKGIISGRRKLDGEDWIQTDAGVSFGNSGGPLITQEGKLTGVVNSKLVGMGIENIAFAVPAKNITTHLSLVYSK